MNKEMLFDQAEKDTARQIRYKKMAFCPTCEKMLDIPFVWADVKIFEFRCSHCNQLLEIELW